MQSHTAKQWTISGRKDRSDDRKQMKRMSKGMATNTLSRATSQVNSNMIHSTDQYGERCCSITLIGLWHPAFWEKTDFV